MAKFIDKDNAETMLQNIKDYVDDGLDTKQSEDTAVKLYRHECTWGVGSTSFIILSLQSDSFASNNIDFHKIVNARVLLYNEEDGYLVYDSGCLFTVRHVGRNPTTYELQCQYTDYNVNTHSPEVHYDVLDSQSSRDFQAATDNVTEYNPQEN